MAEGDLRKKNPKADFGGNARFLKGEKTDMTEDKIITVTKVVRNELSNLLTVYYKYLA
jgi:hypothetical protein